LHCTRMAVEGQNRPVLIAAEYVCFAPESGLCFASAANDHFPPHSVEKVENRGAKYFRNWSKASNTAAEFACPDTQALQGHDDRRSATPSAKISEAVSMRRKFFGHRPMVGFSTLSTHCSQPRLGQKRYHHSIVRSSGNFDFITSDAKSSSTEPTGSHTRSRSCDGSVQS